MENTVVLMFTCKKFEQCWEPFFKLFEKFWPNCPYELIMGTDVGNYPGIKTIEIGTDLGWTRNCIQILNQINADRLIIFFEDFLPCADFDSERIEKLVKHSRDHNIGCLRLQPCPGPTAPWEHDDSLGILQSGDPYRFSWQTAIWDKEFLLSLLIPEETPWQTEVIGTKRASKSNRHFVSVKRGESPIPYIITAVVKGKWQDNALKLLESEGIPMDKITPIIR
jgi:hypothetical protein